MSNTKKELKLATTHFQKILWILSILLLLGNFLLPLCMWDSLPEQVPSHYGLSGTPDAYSGKGSLLLVPIISFFLFLGISLISRFPSVWNVPVTITPENKVWVYTNVKTMLYVQLFLVMLTFFYLTFCSVTGRNIGIFVWIFLFFIFASMFFYLIRACKKPPKKPGNYDCF